MNICFAFLSSFLVTKTFVDLIGSIGNSGTFWLYAAVNFVGGMFLAVFLPETKGKSEDEIRRAFTRST